MTRLAMLTAAALSLTACVDTDAERGLAGYLGVDGPEDDDIMHHGTADHAPKK